MKQRELNFSPFHIFAISGDNAHIQFMQPADHQLLVLLILFYWNCFS